MHIRAAITKKTENNKHQQGYRKTGNLYTAGGHANGAVMEKQYGSFSIVKIKLPHNSAIPTLGKLLKQLKAGI